MWPKGLRTGENWTAPRTLCPLGPPILLTGSLPLPHAPCPDAHLVRYDRFTLGSLCLPWAVGTWGRFLASLLLSRARRSLRAGSAAGRLPCEPRRVPKAGANENIPRRAGLLQQIPSWDSAKRAPAPCHLRWALLCWNPAWDTAGPAPTTLVSGVWELPCSPGPGLRRHPSRHVSGLLRTAGLGTSGMRPGLSRGEQMRLCSQVLSRLAGRC